MTRPPRHGIVAIMQSDASTAPVRAVLTRAARETAYLTIGLLTSSLALTVWVVGVSLSLSLRPARRAGWAASRPASARCSR